MLHIRALAETKIATWFLVELIDIPEPYEIRASRPGVRDDEEIVSGMGSAEFSAR